ncbi:MAG: hypothetical protein V4550_11010 [Gemmatimonadota bacterium]
MQRMLLALLMLQGAAQPAHPPIQSARIVALLEGARIAVINSAEGTTLAERSLGDTTVWKSGHSLGISPAGNQVFVALTSRSQKETAIIRFDLTDYTVHQIAVVADQFEYPWLVVGQRTGRLYLTSDWGFRVATVDPKKPSEVVRYASGRDTIGYGPAMWFDISANEDRMYASYHGNGLRGNGGLDWIDIRGDSLSICSESRLQSEKRGTSCSNPHGRMIPYRDGFVATTGGRLHVYNAKGETIAKHVTGLGDDRNHGMEFALDTVAAVAYPIGSCRRPNQGGVTRVDLKNPLDSTSSYRELAATVCGERVVVSLDRTTLAIASGTGITLMGAESGNVGRKLTTSARVVDLAFVRD